MSSNLILNIRFCSTKLLALIDSLAASPPKKPLKGRGNGSVCWVEKLDGRCKKHEQNRVRRVIFLWLLRERARAHTDTYYSYAGRSGGRSFFSPCPIISEEAVALFNAKLRVEAPGKVNAQSEWFKIALELKSPCPVIPKS